MGHSQNLRGRRGVKVCSNASQQRLLVKKRAPGRFGLDVILHDTLKTVFDRQNALQSVMDKFCFITGIVLPVCISVITCTTLIQCLGLRPDHYFKVMSFLRFDNIKVSGLARQCRGLKKDIAWEIMWMHPEKNIIHETRSMPVYKFLRSRGMILTLLILCATFFYPPPLHGFVP